MAFGRYIETLANVSFAIRYFVLTLFKQANIHWQGVFAWTQCQPFLTKPCLVYETGRCHGLLLCFSRFQFGCPIHRSYGRWSRKSKTKHVCESCETAGQKAASEERNFFWTRKERKLVLPVCSSLHFICHTNKLLQFQKRYKKVMARRTKRNYIAYVNREEKSLRQVAIAAKFLVDNKPKTSLKKRICPVSNFEDLIQFHLIRRMMAKTSGVKCKRTVSKSRKGKIIFFCVVLAFFVNRVREIRKFHVAVVQRWLRNV